MKTLEERWCSWCYEKTNHKLISRSYISRNGYQCTSCGNYTVKCRYCSSMAKHRPAERKENEGFFESYKNDWANELCDEHNGTIASFDKLSAKINNLEDYNELFKKKKINLYKAGMITGTMIAGTAVISPISFLAAPALASALGSLGILGAAGTGTAISTLSGAALTSASLAAIGPAGMAGGVAIITAAGAALGATQGAVISNNYFGSIKGFKIEKLKSGTGPSLLFINGFLSQKNENYSDWQNAVSKKYNANPWYSVSWEASTLAKLGKYSGNASKMVGKKVAGELAKTASKQFAKKLNPLAWATIAGDLINNPWHNAMVKASMTGILLADLLTRTQNDDGFILMGHSLGARVIYYTLEALSTRTDSIIDNVYLLGGAVGDQVDGWNNASKAVNGIIYNCYSKNDGILKNMYRGANALMSKPIGINKIKIDSPKIINKNVSSFVNGHMEYKNQFNKILKSIHV